MPRNLRIALLIALAAILVAGMAACKPKQQPQQAPSVAPPVIGQEGVLRAGVDLDAPPFAGTDGGRQAGIDVDVASAIAQRLGLRVELVDVKPGKAADALKAGTVDVVLSVPLSEKALAGTSIAGTYLEDAPAFFAKVASGSAEPTVTIDNLAGRTVAAQKGALSFWLLENALGEGTTRAYPTLREAFEASADGKTKLVAGDAVTGSYIARDFPGFRIVGQVGPATRLGVAVSPDNTKMAETVQGALDALDADGVLDTIRSKWVGDMPALSSSVKGSAP